MNDMPHYVGEAIHRTAPGEVRAVHARGGEAVAVSFEEETGYFVSYFALEGLEDEDPTQTTARLRWQERFGDDGLRAGLRFSELRRKLPEDPGEKQRAPRYENAKEIPRWGEVEDFLFS